MSIASEIQRLSGVRDDIFNSITNKGVTVPAGSTFSSCPSLIDQIEGGGGGTVTSMINPTFTASGYVSGYRPFTATQKPVATPEYIFIPAHSGAAAQHQNQWFTLFLNDSDYESSIIRYQTYNTPLYLIFSGSVELSNPDYNLKNSTEALVSRIYLSNYFVGDNYNNNYNFNLQQQDIFSAVEAETAQSTYLYSAARFFLQIDLNSILDESIRQTYAPSSTQYGNGYSISFKQYNYWRDYFSRYGQYITSIASGFDMVNNVTTAYPYPTYPSTTTGYITNDITGREFFVRNGLLHFARYEATIGHSGYKNIVYDNSPEGGSESFAMDDYSITAFSSNMLKNNITAKTNYNVASTAYTYNYGTTQTAYSGFEGI